MSFGPTATIINYTSLGLGQFGESLFPANLEACVDYDADANCSDFELDDSDVDVDVKHEYVDSMDLSDFD